MKIRKTQMLINNPVYLGLSILDLNKTVIYEFFYDYLKPKIWWKLKTLLCEYRQFPPLHKSRRYLERYCRRCWNKTWYFQLWTGPLPKEKNKKLIGFKNDDLNRKFMKEPVGLIVKTYSYLKVKQWCK